MCMVVEFHRRYPRKRVVCDCVNYREYLDITWDSSAAEVSGHSRIWSQLGKAVPGSHLPTGHIGQLNRAQ